MSIFITNFSNA